MSESHSVYYRIRVAVPVFIFRIFDYAVNATQFQHIQAGCRVRVPFGRQKLVAVVVEKIELTSLEQTSFELKAIDEVLDVMSILSPQLLQLLTWAAHYYQYPLGEVIQQSLPTLLRQGKPADVLQHKWVAINVDEQRTKLTDRQSEAYAILRLHRHGATEDILNASGVSSSTLKQLEKKGKATYQAIEQPFTVPSVELAQLPLTANAEQQHAIKTVLAHQHQYAGFLLDGLTGSGKTEVYLQVMYEVLKQGKQVLVLVPEIGLTPQTIARFQSRFRIPIAILHSGLNDAKRLHAWLNAASGQSLIVLGTRSAILTPLANLGLIILDEEHDLSYKQQEGFRYHARDIALYRAKLQQCPIVLGSATPSLESYHLVEQKKLIPLQLNQRAGQAQLPQLHVVDLTASKKQFGISRQIMEQIHQHLQQQSQVLIFLNRRGYAPVLFCEECGWQADCPQCDAHFTVHHQPYLHLQCHHCGLVHRFPEQCANGHAERLTTLGMGTTKLQQHLQTIFPTYPILRIDRDSTKKPEDWVEFNQQIHQNKPLILLGTQMLSKGHHFPYVTLVVILDIDAGFFSVDFRAGERTAQQIIQVAGRAGRATQKGEVYLQSYRPDSPLLKLLIEKDYRHFARHTLDERRVAQFPPYGYAVLLRISSKNAEYNLQFLQQGVALFYQLNGEESKHQVRILGPIPAPMSKKAGYYLAHVLFLSLHRKYLHQCIHKWWQHVLTLPKQHYLRMSLDIDPQEFSSV